MVVSHVPAVCLSFVVQWNFTLPDLVNVPVIAAISDHTPIINFSVQPKYFYDWPRPDLPDDVRAIVNDYAEGASTSDSRLPDAIKRMGEYHARYLAWYTNGGFTDEFGVRVNSPHYFPIERYEVLNEVNLEVRRLHSHTRTCTRTCT
jgi:hypothetical protein